MKLEKRVFATEEEYQGRRLYVRLGEHEVEVQQARSRGWFGVPYRVLWEVAMKLKVAGEGKAAPKPRAFRRKRTRT
jgi:hypothetical protein